MCIVKELAKADRKVIIQTKDGKNYSSDYFSAEGGDEKIQNVLNHLKNLNHLKENQIECWYLSCRYDEETIYISEHALERLKERNNWSKKTSLRMIQKVYDEGLDPKDIHGPISKWIRTREKVKDEGDILKLYGQNLYIFNRQTLITVYPVPKNSSANWMI